MRERRESEFEDRDSRHVLGTIVAKLNRARPPCIRGKSQSAKVTPNPYVMLASTLFCSMVIVRGGKARPGCHTLRPFLPVGRNMYIRAQSQYFKTNTFEMLLSSIPPSGHTAGFLSCVRF